jgi:hypothetical protein
MNEIIFPLKAQMRGATVADLQDGLRLLLDKGSLQVSDADRQGFLGRLQVERSDSSYGPVTGKLVAIFQEQHRLQPTGEVTEQTAKALNTTLREFGAFEGQPAAAETLTGQRAVSGRVSYSAGQPSTNATVRAFHASDPATGQRAVRLGTDTTDTEGAYTIRYDPVPDTEGVNLSVVVLDQSGRTVQTSKLIANAPKLAVVDIVVPAVKGAAASRLVEGRILFEQGQPAAGLRLRLYLLAFGGSESATRVSETTTASHGLYTLPYVTNGRPANVEVRAVDAAGNEVALSKIVLGAAEKEVLNLVAPATLQPPAPEFTRLTRDLQPHVGDLSKLAAARENADRSDLSLLHEASGWDARLLALAATATKLSSTRETGLPQDALYGLLRAGLPSDKLELARVSSEAFDQALNKARTAGIVSLSDPQAASVKKTWETFSINTRLAVPAPGSRATYGDLLSQIDLSSDDQKTFAALYLNHRGDPADLWRKATEQGLGDAVPRLQLQGKLAFLTVNNPALTAELQSEIDEAGPAQLVEKDLYKKDAWKERIDKLTQNDPAARAAFIPPAYGEADDPFDAYADDMARKVRISFPTQVVARMIDKGELPVPEEQRSAVSSFLGAAAAQGFRLGQTPVTQFLRASTDSFARRASDDFSSTTEAVKALQRIYQITPSNDSMQVLMSAGLTSAQDIVAYPYETFLDRYGALFPSREEATLVYRKAEQVSNVTYNLFTIASALNSEPPVFAISPSPEETEAAKNELIKHFPTMESLFGSMDFCECEHCRTVLSPAAYFVDLLQFIDTDTNVWNNTMQDWQDKHGGAPYPFRNQDAFDDFLTRWHIDHPGEPDPDTEITPYQVLVERRPDLPNIQLTCENTQTAMPHIDIVNEILEYYVANHALGADAAHDTGDAKTPELLAEPQHILPAAYDALLGASYPLALPFDLWLETARQFCNYFETPFSQVMETFRPGDALFVPAQTYDRAAVFIESLNLSPAEYAIFTNPNPSPSWFELYGYQSENEATTVAVDADNGQRVDVHSAKALSRRLGVTYKQLVEVVSTAFVNPQREALVILRKLDIDVADVFFYEEHAHLLGEDESTMSQEDQKRLAEVQAFEKRLDDFTARYPGFNARTWLQDAVSANAFDHILELADPDAGCNFDQTTLRYANGEAADPLAFLKLNLFVRLWRKLGWTIEEIDRALQAFVPKNAPFDQASLNKSPLKTALIYIAHLKSLEAQAAAGKGGRIKLLTLWSPLPTTGANPLYAQLFLTRSVLKTDAVFDDPLGRYLTQPGLLIKDHLLTLQGTLSLTADEIGGILKEDGTDIGSAPLSLDAVSLLYRYRLLSKSLKLSIVELIALKRLSGLDPFKPLDAEPLAQLEDDHPFAQTLRFVEVARQVKQSGMKVADLQYLLRHSYDPAGKDRPDQDAILILTKTLADGIRGIQTEHGVPADPGAMSDDVLRQKLSLALPAEVVDKLSAMIAGTAEFTATEANVIPADQLDPSAFAGSDVIRQASYHETRQEQRLTVRGVLFDAQTNQLKLQFPGTVMSHLLDNAQVQPHVFFEKFLLKQPLNPSANAGFLEAADFDKLFAAIPAIDDSLTEEQQQTARQASEQKMREKRARLATTFLPFLQQRLIRQFVVQTMTAATGADGALVESLLSDKILLADPTQNDQTLLDAFTATGPRGITATFSASADGSGPALATVTSPDADTAIKPVGTNSAQFDGYLEVPAAGAYRFYAVLGKQNAAADLSFAHLPEPLLNGVAATDDAEISQFVELKPGTPYRFTLRLRNLNGGDARFLVQGETLPKDGLARLTLYPDSAVVRSQRAQILLAKALRVIQGLGLTERELRHILTHAAAFDGVSLSQLPTREGDDAPDKAMALFQQFLRLTAYARLKEELAGGGDDLIGVFEAPSLDEAYTRIGRIARREKDAVQAAAEALFAAPVFADEQTLERLWNALQIVETFGVLVGSVAAWTRIVSAAATPAQRFAIARDLKDSIRARFEPDAWQRVAQPIFDKLRQRQRDALVAHVCHTRGFDRIEQLFEYFLIDPGMEPVVQTSRIRAAIASVQIFIQRCLLNLEPKVHPSVINSKHWQWMKLYRVWEANRKIFIFPENWLEPEFRDDKTYLFKELEGTLLQGDVSNDLAENAFFNYLKKLETLARLDIVAMYCEDNPDPALNQLHVIGRTYNEPHKYFYRRYAHQMWTPWEPVTAEIDGNHIVPVVWRDRLNLFWVKFLEKGDPAASPSEGNAVIGAEIKASIGESKAYMGEAKSYEMQLFGGNKSNASQKVAEMTLGGVSSVMRTAAARKLIDVQLYWSEHFDGEWSTSESGGPSASLSAGVPFDFNSNSVFIHASKEYEDGEERGVLIHLGGAVNQAFRVVSRNSRPERANRGAPPPMPYNAPGVSANRYTGTGALKVTFAQRIETEDGKTPKVTLATPSILQKGGAFTLLPCANTIALGTPEIASLVTPVFYQDNRAQTFFMEPTLREQTIEEWQEWVTRTPAPEVEWDTPDWWGKLELEPMSPAYKIPKPVNPGDPVWRFEIDPRARYDFSSKQDWIANESTVVQFDGELIGPHGRAGLAVMPAGKAAAAAAGAGSVNVNAGSGLAAGSSIVAVERNALESAGLAQTAGGLNVIGSGGLNSALLKNLGKTAGTL